MSRKSIRRLHPLLRHANLDDFGTFGSKLFHEIGPEVRVGCTQVFFGTVAHCAATDGWWDLMLVAFLHCDRPLVVTQQMCTLCAKGCLVGVLVVVAG